MINEDYDLELEKTVQEIKKRNAKRVLIQLGEGLKPRAIEIQDYIQREIGENSPEIFFWLNSCYGKCDIPVFLNNKDNDIDLLIQFGHWVLLITLRNVFFDEHFYIRCKWVFIILVYWHPDTFWECFFCNFWCSVNYFWFEYITFNIIYV